jgi:hypothetical protein
VHKQRAGTGVGAGAEGKQQGTGDRDGDAVGRCWLSVLAELLAR